MLYACIDVALALAFALPFALALSEAKAGGAPAPRIHDNFCTTCRRGEYGRDCSFWLCRPCCMARFTYENGQTRGRGRTCSQHQADADSDDDSVVVATGQPAAASNRP